MCSWVLGQKGFAVCGDVGIFERCIVPVPPVLMYRIGVVSNSLEVVPQYISTASTASCNKEKNTQPVIQLGEKVADVQSSVITVAAGGFMRAATI